MSGENSEPLPAIAGECAELATVIGAARHTIGGGGHVALEPLVERLSRLLDTVETAPAADQRRLLPRLIGLAEEIEALGGVIATERQRCSEALAKGEVCARAAAAYAKTDLH